MKLNLKVVFGILIFSTLSMAEKGQIVNEKYFNISIGTQIKNMDTRELIYKDKNSDDRLSELDWRMDGVTMIGGEIEITPTNRFSIKLGGYTSYGDNYSTMDDYDWLDYSTGTGDNDYDMHTESRTELDYAIDINLDLSYKFYDGENNDFSVLVGIDYMHNKWLSYGANGIYTDQKTGIKYPIHDNSSTMGLSYEQTQLVGYIGLGYELTYKKVNFGLDGKKGMGTTESTDEHVMRSITFEDEMDADFLETSIYVSYNFTPNFNGKLEYIYTFSENDGHGDETMSFNKTTSEGTVGETHKIKDSVGFSNESSIVKLSFGYSF